MKRCRICDCPIDEGYEASTFCRERDGDLCEGYESEREQFSTVTKPTKRVSARRKRGS